jgi:hypothetical protein
MYRLLAQLPVLEHEVAYPALPFDTDNWDVESVDDRGLIHIPCAKEQLLRRRRRNKTLVVLIVM